MNTKNNKKKRESQHKIETAFIELLYKVILKNVQ